MTRVLDPDVTTLPAATRTIQFADAAVSFDGADVPGQAYRLYQAAFNRKPAVRASCTRSTPRA